MSVPRYLFSKVADIQLATLLKKRFQHMCFTGSFAKFLERFFYRTPSCDCFCHETFIKDETHKFFSSNHLNIQTFVSIFLYLARIIGKQALLRSEVCVVLLLSVIIKNKKNNSSSCMHILTYVKFMNHANLNLWTTLKLWTRQILSLHPILEPCYIYWPTPKFYWQNLILNFFAGKQLLTFDIMYHYLP